MPVANESVLEAQERNDEEQLREYHQLRWKAWVSVLAGFIAMVLSMPLMSMAQRRRPAADERPVHELVHERPGPGIAQNHAVAVLD